MESLVADFVQFSSTVAKLLILEGRMTRSAPNFEIFRKFPHLL